MSLALRYATFILLTALAGVIVALTAASQNTPRFSHLETISPEAEQTKVPPTSSSTENISAEIPARPLASLPVSVPNAYLAASSVTMKSEFPTQGSFAPINERTRGAVVNILCTRKDRDATRASTGSGVIIDKRGVILTNAHVAQLFLLKDKTSAGDPSCIIRTGNPAESTYHAELLFLTKSWIEEFAPDPENTDPVGTGEEDFALLLITTPYGNKSLPDTFPALMYTTSTDSIEKGDRVLVASYPAFSANARSVRDELFLVSTLAEIENLYTFDRKHLDLFSIKGNIASQQGTSGGAVVSEEGTLLGIAVTSTDEVFALDRRLQILTMEHIDSRFKAQTGFSLDEYLREDVHALLSKFQKESLPGLTSSLLKRF